MFPKSFRAAIDAAGTVVPNFAGKTSGVETKITADLDVHGSHNVGKGSAEAETGADRDDAGAGVVPYFWDPFLISFCFGGSYFRYEKFWGCVHNGFTLVFTLVLSMVGLAYKLTGKSGQFRLLVW